MKEVEHIQKKYAAACNFEELWDILHEALIPYGCTSIFFGFGHSGKLAGLNGIMDSIWYKTSHPEEYCSYYDNKYYIIR